MNGTEYDRRESPHSHSLTVMSKTQPVFICVVHSYRKCVLRHRRNGVMPNRCDALENVLNIQEHRHQSCGKMTIFGCAGACDVIWRAFISKSVDCISHSRSKRKLRLPRTSSRCICNRDNIVRSRCTRIPTGFGIQWVGQGASAAAACSTFQFGHLET